MPGSNILRNNTGLQHCIPSDVFLVLPYIDTFPFANCRRSAGAGAQQGGRAAPCTSRHWGGRHSETSIACCCLPALHLQASTCPVPGKQGCWNAIQRTYALPMSCRTCALSCHESCPTIWPAQQQSPCSNLSDQLPAAALRTCTERRASAFCQHEQNYYAKTRMTGVVGAVSTVCRFWFNILQTSTICMHDKNCCLQTRRLLQCAAAHYPMLCYCPLPCTTIAWPCKVPCTTRCPALQSALLYRVPCLTASSVLQSALLYSMPCRITSIMQSVPHTTLTLACKQSLLQTNCRCAVTTISDPSQGLTVKLVCPLADTTAPSLPHKEMLACVQRQANFTNCLDCV